MRWYRIREYLLASLWFVPILCVLAGVALSTGTIAIDRVRGDSIVPRTLSGDAESALGILTTVSLSMVTLTALVLTITMVVVQLAMGQFTPRVLRTIVRDRPSQFAIGIFVATFAHAMLVMREVQQPTPSDPDGFVPGLAIVIAFVLIVICIMVLVSYVHHIGRALTVASLIDSVGDEGRTLLDKLYPEDRGEAPAPPGELGPVARAVCAPQHGVVVAVDTDELAGFAKEHDLVLRLVAAVGDFVPEGATIVEVFGRGEFEDDDVLRSIALANERTLTHDFAFSIRMLVDVGVRAVSPAMADPTTTTQAIDRIHDLLRQLATRPFPSGRIADADGVVRVLLPTVTWDGYVHLAVDELRQDAARSLQVTRRLQAMLRDLLDVAPPDRRAPLEEQLRLLHEGLPESFAADVDRRAAATPDQQGIGSGEDVAERESGYAAASVRSFSRR
jgi:uncharacterized membrane protein